MEQQIEELRQEVYTLQSQLHTERANNEWYKDELAQQNKALEDIQQQHETEKYTESAKTNKKMQEMKEELEQSEEDKRQLQTQIEGLEQLIKQQAEVTLAEISNRTYVSEDLSELQQENAQLMNDNTSLKAECLAATTEVNLLKSEISGLKSYLLTKDEELEEARCQISSYAATVERTKLEVIDLQTELEVMQVNNHQGKGNSLFSEVEDRRVCAEKNLLSMKKKIDIMKEKYTQEQAQHQKLKNQMFTLLHMRQTAADSEYVQKIEQQLSTERTAKKELMAEVQTLRKKTTEQASTLSSMMSMISDSEEGEKSAAGKKKYVDYLLKLLDSKEQEVQKKQSAVDALELQLMNKDHQLTEAEGEINKSQREVEALRNTCFELKLQIQEIKIKYDPESVKQKEVKTVREHILSNTGTPKVGDLGGDCLAAELLQSQANTSMNQTHLDKKVSLRSKSQASTTSVSKSFYSENAASYFDNFLDSNKENQEVFHDNSTAGKHNKIRGKCVSIGDVVTIVNEDGSLSSDVTSTKEGGVKMSKTNPERPQGRQKTSNIVHVSHSNSDKEDCKMQ